MATKRLNGVVAQLRRLTAKAEADRLSDRQLLERFVRGRSEAAFQTLVGRHGLMVLGVCRRVLGPGADAEDAFQATFLVLVRKAASVGRQGSLRNWLYGVAYRTAARAKVDAARRRAREAHAPARAPADPLAEITVRELFAVLDMELARLPAPYRGPLLLCYLEGKTRNEAAAELGWSLAALGRRLERGRALLRNRLARRGLALPAALVPVFLPGDAAAAVPVALAAATVKAATQVAAGGAAAVASARAAILAEGVCQAMSATKAKLALVLFLTIGLLAAGAGLVAQTGGARPGAGAGRATGHADAEGGSGQPARKNGGAGKRTVSPRFLLGKKADAWISFLAWGPRGKTLAAVTLDAADAGQAVRIDGCAVRLWDVRSGRVKRTLADRELKNPLWTQAGIAFCPDGKMVAAKGDPKGLGESGWLVLWDAETGRVRHRLKHTYVHHIAFSPDGRTLAAAGPDAGNREAIRLWDVRTGRLQRTLQTAGMRAGRVAFSADGKRLGAVLSGEAPSVVWWDVASGKDLPVPGAPDGYSEIAFARDGKTFLAFAPKKRQLAVWNTATGKAPRTRELRADFAEGSALRFAASPDGKTVALSGKRGREDGVVLFDVRTGKQTRTLKGPGGPILSLVFSPDGQALAGGTRDRRICLWDLGKKPTPAE